MHKSKIVFVLRNSKAGEKKETNEGIIKLFFLGDIPTVFELLLFILILMPKKVREE